jgi:glycine cleavage system aminomethyltransferase T
VHFRGHPNRALVGLYFPQSSRPPGGRPALWDGEREVGWVASWAWSACRERAVGVGFVRRELAQPGNQVVLAPGPSDLAVTISALPFDPL